ncbi:hypothetical protein IAT38_003192 [Cryptococcus sp. DSM 104549]
MIHTSTATTQKHYPGSSRTRRMSLSPPLRSSAPAANRLSLPPLPAIRSPIQVLAAIPSHSKTPTHDDSHLGSYFSNHRKTCSPRSFSSGQVICDLDVAGGDAEKRRVAAMPEDVLHQPFSLRIEEMAEGGALNVDLGGAPTPDLEGKDPSPPPPYGTYLSGIRPIALLTPSDEVLGFPPFDPVVDDTGVGLALDLGMAVGKGEAFGLGFDGGGVKSKEDDDETEVLRHGARVLSDYKSEAPHGMRPLLLLSRRSIPIATIDATSPMVSVSPTSPSYSAPLDAIRGTDALRGLGISVGLGLTRGPRSSPLFTRVQPAATAATRQSMDEDSSLFHFGGDSDSANSQGASDCENDSVSFSPIRLPPTVSSALASLAGALAPAHLFSPSQGAGHTSEAKMALKSCMRGKGSLRLGEKKSRVRWAEMLVEGEPVDKMVGNKKAVVRMAAPSPVCADGSPTRPPRYSGNRLAAFKTTTITTARTARRPPTVPPPTPLNLPLQLLRELLAFISALAALSEWTVLLLAKMWIMVCVVYNGMMADTAGPKIGVLKTKSRAGSRATILPSGS